MRKKRSVFDASFKLQAVQMIQEQDVTGINQPTARKHAIVFPPPCQPPFKILSHGLAPQFTDRFTRRLLSFTQQEDA